MIFRDRSPCWKPRSWPLNHKKSSVYAEQKTLDVQIQSGGGSDSEDVPSGIPSGEFCLTKYKEEGEIAAPGQPLYKVANLDELILRAYVSGNQLILGHYWKGGPGSF